MPDANEETLPLSLSDSKQACLRVAEFYHSGMNCDKAVFMVLQDVLDLAKNRWDFTDYYSDKPDDTDRFVCKVVAAGAVAIYLDIITRRERELGETEPIDVEPIGRVNALVDSMLAETAEGRGENLATFDPFSHDRYLKEGIATGKMRREYKDRSTQFFTDFKKTFNCQDCVDILGFDPFSYELYDDAIQEEIESGEWMEKCVECMQHIVRTLHRNS